ncbi:hypothetical protein [Aureivirga sp. CE67]|uniref:hypothetical protein n=1 Tax=Aureivirga sp. CE67 TaxID=1788983 RepID=UPI0018CBA647|nr:hypothetical protein [Aureivirga sp. CE67]
MDENIISQNQSIENWINSSFNTELNTEDILPIKDFTLLWNIYEDRLFNRDYHYSKLKEVILGTSLIDNDIDECFNYFKERYVFGCELRELRFSKLNLHPNSQELLKNYFLNSESLNVNEKAYCVAVIVKAYRNNLFHGSKNFVNLNTQSLNFKFANVFLKLILERNINIVIDQGNNI